MITALSNGTAPLSAPPTPGSLTPLSPLGAPAISPLCNVDTLLGMATTLWPIIHRLAGLRGLKTELEAAVRRNEPPSKVAVLRTEFESTAQAIETALLQWQPQLPPGFIPDEVDTNPDSAATDPAAPNHLADGDSPIHDAFKNPFRTDNSTATATATGHRRLTQEHARIASIYHNALAYQQAALVHLYRTALGRGRTHAAVQAHARAALAHCAATAGHGGPMSALLWPLFVAACEAVAPADRALAARAFAVVGKRQGMRNIDRAWAIVGEVWRRADEREFGSAGGGFWAGDKGADGAEEVGGLAGEPVEEGDNNSGEELWRLVSREMGVSIVFG